MGLIIFCKISSLNVENIPHNIVMNMNNVMLGMGAINVFEYISFVVRE